MDILISSNLERLIYEIAGRCEAVRSLMAQLFCEGRYEITDGMRAQLHDFYGNYASEEETKARIAAVYGDTGYVMDTHTAVAKSVYEKYRAPDGRHATKTVIASTASPFKFTGSVMKAIDPSCEETDDFALADRLSETGKRFRFPGRWRRSATPRCAIRRSARWIRCRMW